MTDYVSELREALSRSADPDIRAVARRQAAAVPATDLRICVEQFHERLAAILESQVRRKARQDVDALAQQIPPLSPPSGAPNSAKWAHIRRNAAHIAEHDKLLDRSMHVPSRGRVLFRYCTPDDCLELAEVRYRKAKADHQAGDYYRSIAERMLKIGAAKVEDLPADQLAS